MSDENKTSGLEAQATEPKKKGTATDPMEELVSFTAPIDPTARERDILLSVNGETIRIKRGSTVEIKRKFLECWNNSVAQKNAAYAAMEQAMEGGKAPVLEM